VNQVGFFFSVDPKAYEPSSTGKNSLNSLHHTQKNWIVDFGFIFSLFSLLLTIRVFVPFFLIFIFTGSFSIPLLRRPLKVLPLCVVDRIITNNNQD